MSIRLYNVTTEIPKYVNGKWTFNNKNKKFEFEKNELISDIGKKSEIPIAPRLKFGIQFADNMTEIEENIFREIFRRSIIHESHDCDMITLQDIKDVVLFTAARRDGHNVIGNLIIEFLHTKTFDQFLNDLIIYFEYFLKLIEFLLIRRDDCKIKCRSLRSIELERMLAEYLVQYRLILAREYSKIVIGNCDMNKISSDIGKFHHLANKSKKSKTEKDSEFFETIFSFCTQCVWIAMHRKSYTTIDYEINRLFRSGHFNIAKAQHLFPPKYSVREQELLYGTNDHRFNYRNQRSPLILEILNIKPKNLDVLWIGEHKYRGENPRMYELELEYATPESQLSLVDCHHGILGNPTKYYTSMLTLGWHAVRHEGFSAQDFDPYQLERQPILTIPNWKEFQKQYSRNKPTFQLINKKFEPQIAKRQTKLWQNRDKILDALMGNNKGTIKNKLKILDDRQSENVLEKCKLEIEQLDQHIEINSEKIIADFLIEKQRTKLKTNNKI